MEIYNYTFAGYSSRDVVMEFISDTILENRRAVSYK